MDPLGDLFSFINSNDLKEGEGVQNDIEKKKGGQKSRRKLLNIICQLCEEGEVHELQDAQAAGRHQAGDESGRGPGQ